MLCPFLGQGGAISDSTKTLLICIHSLDFLKFYFLGQQQGICISCSSRGYEYKEREVQAVATFGAKWM